MSRPAIRFFRPPEVGGGRKKIRILSADMVETVPPIVSRSHQISDADLQNHYSNLGSGNCHTRYNCWIWSYDDAEVQIFSGSFFAFSQISDCCKTKEELLGTDLFVGRTPCGKYGKTLIEKGGNTAVLICGLNSDMLSGYVLAGLMFEHEHIIVGERQFARTSNLKKMAKHIPSQREWLKKYDELTTVFHRVFSKAAINRIVWDYHYADQVKEAREKFYSLLDQGSKAFEVRPDGSAGKELLKFDPCLGEVLLVGTSGFSRGELRFVISRKKEAAKAGQFPAVKIDPKKLTLEQIVETLWDIQHKIGDLSLKDALLERYREITGKIWPKFMG